MENRKEPHKDHELFLLLCNNSLKGVQKIYVACFPTTKKMVLSNHGSLVDAEDVFQEALVGLNGYCSKEFTLQVPLVKFMYRICKNIWLKKLNKRGKQGVTFLDTMEYEIKRQILNTDKQKELSNARIQLTYKYLALLEPHEERTLRLFYFEKWALIDIAKEMGFSGENSAKAQKSKYLKKLRLLMRNDPDFE